MEIRFFNELDNISGSDIYKDFTDLRFKTEDNSYENIKRRLNRISGEPDISACAMNNKDIIACFIGSSNTWAGLKTIYCNGLLVNKNTDKKTLEKAVNALIKKVLDKAIQNNFENLLTESETGGSEFKNIFSSLKEVHSRVLINYLIPTKKLIETTGTSAKNLVKSEFKIKPADVNNLTPYLGFMDTRQGWLSSNQAIGKEHGDELICVKTQFDSINSICVYNSESGVISRLATMPLARRGGFASSLLNYAASHIKAKNTIVVDINKKNEEARCYLENLGFNECLVKEETSYSLNI